MQKSIIGLLGGSGGPGNNGKENGNYYLNRGICWGRIRIMEKENSMYIT